MLPTIQILVFLLIVIAATAVVAARLKIPPAILLVLTGVILALFPGLPRVELAPDLVLLVVLPPIIYSSAVAMSWREFRFNLRPISLLAVGCVMFTTLAAAAVTHWLLGLSWPVGFVLGAIISPPDPVAPLSIARRMQLPRRIAVILEGEGLANDATALILYRFAVAAVSIGSFSLGDAVGMFTAIVVGELLWGIGVGWVMLRLRRWVGDARVTVIRSRRSTSGRCATSGSAAAIRSTATASKRSATIGLIRCASRPFEPRLPHHREVAGPLGGVL